MAMAAMSATAVTNASNVPARGCASSTSNAAFGSSSVRFAPVPRRSAAGKACSGAFVRASSSEEPKVSARQAMVGLLAAGAILVSGGVPSAPALAAGAGPGGDGAAATAKGADKLLKKADKLTENDSPARFGEGLKDAGSTATQAGSATASNVQDVADAAVKKARENLSKAKAAFGNVIVNKDK